MVGDKWPGERNELRIAEHHEKITGNVDNGVRQDEIGPATRLDDEIAHALEFAARHGPDVLRYDAEAKSQTQLGESLIPEDDRFIHERLAWIVRWPDHNYPGSLQPPCPKLGRRDLGKRQNRRNYEDRCTH